MLRALSQAVFERYIRRFLVSISVFNTFAMHNVLCRRRSNLPKARYSGFGLDGFELHRLYLHYHLLLYGASGIASRHLTFRPKPVIRVWGWTHYNHYLHYSLYLFDNSRTTAPPPPPSRHFDFSPQCPSFGFWAGRISNVIITIYTTLYFSSTALPPPPSSGSWPYLAPNQPPHSNSHPFASLDPSLPKDTFPPTLHPRTCSITRRKHQARRPYWSATNLERRFQKGHLQTQPEHHILYQAPYHTRVQETRGAGRSGGCRSQINVCAASDNRWLPTTRFIFQAAVYIKEE
jgi:hypothetical protein